MLREFTRGKGRTTRQNEGRLLFPFKVGKRRSLGRGRETSRTSWLLEEVRSLIPPKVRPSVLSKSVVEADQTVSVSSAANLFVSSLTLHFALPLIRVLFHSASPSTETHLFSTSSTLLSERVFPSRVLFDLSSPVRSR